MPEEKRGFNAGLAVLGAALAVGMIASSWLVSARSGM